MADVHVGPGRAIDPDRYFVIIANQLGNGLSSSPTNMPRPVQHGPFPAYPDWRWTSRAQHKLATEQFGIERLELVCGGSMGAQQTYEWAVRYPDMVKRAAPLAGTAKNTPHDFLFVETLTEAITSDPAWNAGWYTDPARRAPGPASTRPAVGGDGFSVPRCSSRRRGGSWVVSSLRDFIVGFVEHYFLPMGSQQPVVYGLEVAAR